MQVVGWPGFNKVLGRLAKTGNGEHRSQSDSTDGQLSQQLHPGPGLNPQAAASTVLGLLGAVLVPENGHFGTSETLPSRGGSGRSQTPDDRPEIEFPHLRKQVGCEIHQKTQDGRPSFVCSGARGGAYRRALQTPYQRVSQWDPSSPLG